MQTNYDMALVHQRILDLISEIGPTLGEILSEQASIPVAYILIAVPANVKHREQAMMTNIATKGALRGVLDNALAHIVSEIRKIQ